MMDPELAGMVDLLPKMDLLDPVAARQAFEDILVAIKIEIPGVETLDIEDRIAQAFGGLKAVPTTVVIGRDGNIIARSEGELAPESLRRLLDEGLAQGN